MNTIPSKRSYIVRVAILWSIIFAVFSFLLQFFLGESFPEKSIFLGVITELIARFIVSLPFGLIIGIILWKNKSKS